MTIDKTIKVLKHVGFLALLLLTLIFMNFTFPEHSITDSPATTIDIGDPLDAAAVEKELAPYLERLATNRNDAEALTFLNRTFVYLSIKYVDEKQALNTVITDLCKKYKAPIVTEFAEGAQSMTAKLLVE